MGKVRIIIEKCATRFRTELRRKLDTLPPKARLAVIAGMLVPFAAGCSIRQLPPLPASEKEVAR